MRDSDCRVTSLVIVATLAFAANAVAQSREAFTAQPEGVVPTYYADVLPVVQKNCAECHQPQGMNSGGRIAPMSLMTYEEARRWASRIAKQVSEGTMPPWNVHPDLKGTFLNERYLEDWEKRTLIAWARGGTPAGDPADAPPPVQLRKTGGDDWWIGEPDLTLFFDEPYLVEDDVSDQYINFEVELTEAMMPEARWLKGREARPGGPHVHHIVGGFVGMTPGSPPSIYPEGYASVVCKGPRPITFNMHYNKIPGPGTAVEDLTGGALSFYQDGEVIRHVIESRRMAVRDIAIPAGDPNYAATMDYVFEEDMLILRLGAHMHLRGKAAKYEITYPDGKHEVLLDIPHYDFGWQQRYWFQEPVLAPKGSKVTMTFWFDNSADNPHNPDPTREVVWGGPTYMEMALGGMSVTRVEPVNIDAGEPIPEEYLARCNEESIDAE